MVEDWEGKQIQWGFEYIVLMLECNQMELYCLGIFISLEESIVQMQIDIIVFLESLRV